jgi:hypothetical protein
MRSSWGGGHVLPGATQPIWVVFKAHLFERGFFDHQTLPITSPIVATRLAEGGRRPVKGGRRRVAGSARRDEWSVAIHCHCRKVIAVGGDGQAAAIADLLRGRVHKKREKSAAGLTARRRGQIESAREIWSEWRLTRPGLRPT